MGGAGGWTRGSRVARWRGGARGSVSTRGGVLSPRGATRGGRGAHLRLLHGDVHVSVEAREDPAVVDAAVQLHHHGLAADGLEEVRGGLGGAHVGGGGVRHGGRFGLRHASALRSLTTPQRLPRSNANRALARGAPKCISVERTNFPSEERDKTCHILRDNSRKCVSVCRITHTSVLPTRDSSN